MTREAGSLAGGRSPSGRRPSLRSARRRRPIRVVVDREPRKPLRFDQQGALKLDAGENEPEAGPSIAISLVTLGENLERRVREHAGLFGFPALPLDGRGCCGSVRGALLLVEAADFGGHSSEEGASLPLRRRRRQPPPGPPPDVQRPPTPALLRPAAVTPSRASCSQSG